MYVVKLCKYLLLIMFVCVDLEEDWYHSDDPINAGISFYVKVHKYFEVDCTDVKM